MENLTLTIEKQNPAAVSKRKVIKYKDNSINKVEGGGKSEISRKFMEKSIQIEELIKKTIKKSDFIQIA